MVSKKALIALAACPTVAAFALIGGSSRPLLPTSGSRSVFRRYCSHSNIISPYYANTASAGASATTSQLLESMLAASQELDEHHQQSKDENQQLQDLCKQLDVVIEQPDLLRLESTPDDGVRGVYLNHPVEQGDLILKIPLSSCLRDDKPPDWWTRMKQEQQEDTDGDDEDMEYSYNNPSDEWAARLAASVLDLQLRKEDTEQQSILEGKQMWLSFLPDGNYLRASLPIHWSEPVLHSARCTALELAVDSAYFARAEAIQQLMQGLQSLDLGKDNSELERMCQDALDVVQTRSCRAQQLQDAEDMARTTNPPLRLLAPVFDLLNHGSSNSQGGGCANAQFGVEGGENPFLCVRATRDVNANDEVLIDYGDSAKPAWKCLLSYGFVPRYSMHGVDDDDDDEDDDDGMDEDVAEIYVAGRRYEVGPSTIPYEMVAELSSDPEPELTPEIALKLAKRISEVSFYLLLDDQQKKNRDSNAVDLLDSVDNAEEIIALRAASSLRWAQHRILRACGKGLQEWANR
ncbi:expressed unknown protein [Seminavis robusta]|uniref:SET domain-containing protein n=1 Tax=Seminavis robusta TaxID=568900 RepID=A0A9N8EZC8_9STRA|nr:expressed unknown protein [Seminavis robusta]|eukprot:Sro2207_g319090.1 n/a (519) ;mRNA; r:9084-10640